MPELPEVETTRRGLARGIVGKTIVGGVVLVPKLLKEPVRDPAAFLAGVQGQRVENVRRRGKYLIFGLENGYALVSHLKMRGHMRVVMPADEGLTDKYLCIVFDLDDGSQFRFYDSWTWGEMRLVPDQDAAMKTLVPALATMGVEPLSEGFTAQALKASAGRHAKTSIKACLLNQDVLAGVGNIYADEALHRAGISPLRKVLELTDSQWICLRDQIQAVLAEAIRLEGTTSDNFFDTKGNPGTYTPRVYDRADKPCLACATALKRTKIAGRGTVYCPICQV